MPDPAPENQTREIDVRNLRAVAHPLRVRILQQLWTDGPATSTSLAKVLGESTGTLSWHLRLLAEHGLIEEDPDRGTRRERWWRAPEGTVNADIRSFLDQPELWAQLAAFGQENLAWHYRLASGFHRAAAAGDFGAEWFDAAAFTSWTGERIRMTPDQLAALREEAHAVITRHVEAARATPQAGTEQVIVLCYTFPYRPAGGPEPIGSSGQP